MSASSSSSCPSTARLRHLAADRLASPEVAELVAHLDACAVCQRRLEALTGTTIPSNSPVTFAHQDEAALQDVLHALKSASKPTAAAPALQIADWVRSFLGPATAPDALGRLDVYDVHEVLGHGGMGVVLKAFDTALHRWVAVKVLAPHLAGDPVSRKRFAREAQAAAAIQHENVVAIHTVSEANGLPFLVMEYIEGGSLQSYLNQFGPQDWWIAADLARQVALGLSAAHAEGIVHRDIKPANILVSGEGTRAGAVNGTHKSRVTLSSTHQSPITGHHKALTAPHAPPSHHVPRATQRYKITDFGLARAVDAAQLTESGIVPGTPMYMAPEQALGLPLDARADLFSLGTLLYRLCTGQEAFAAESPMAALRRVCDTEPPPVQALNPEVPGWLAAVIGRLHAKRPGDRYATAAELADHLRQGLETGAVPALAHRGQGLSTGRLAVLVGLAFLAALVIVLSPGWTPLIGEEAVDRAQPGLSPRGILRGHKGPIRAVSFAADGRRLATASEDGTVRLWDPAAATETATLRGQDGAVYAATFAPEGQLLATGGDDGLLKLWSSDTRTLQASYRHGGGSIRRIALSPDGTTAALAGGDRHIELWDLKAGKLHASLHGHQSMVSALAFAPDGRSLASADTGGIIRIWDPVAGKERLSFHGDPVGLRALAFATDGTLASAGAAEREIKMWHAASGKLQRTLGSANSVILTLAFTPRGRYLASGHHNGTVRFWDPTSDQPVLTLRAHQGIVFAVNFSPDGKILASAGEDRLAKLWNVPSQDAGEKR
jgi:serine/threonine protein kinase